MTKRAKKTKSAKASPPPERHFRTGDQAEYLTQYLLSNFGASILVPRQEDRGFDFHCALEFSKKGTLHDFKDTYYVQVKVGRPAPVAFGGLTKGHKWSGSQVRWLFNLQVPLLLGFADIDRHCLELYQTTSRWMVCYQTIGGKWPFTVSLDPGGTISMPKGRKSPSKHLRRAAPHDRRIWHAELGPPLATISLNDLKSPRAILRIKKRLREFIALERRNISHRALQTQWARWITANQTPGKPLAGAWVMEEKIFPAKYASEFYREFGASLSSLICRLKVAREYNKLRAASDLFRMLKKRMKIPAALFPTIEAAMDPKRK